MVQHVRNILKIYDQATPCEVDAGVTWYASANAECCAIAKANSLHINRVVGVVSALSPNNKWHRNLNDARNMVTTYKEGGHVEDVTVCTYRAMRSKAWSVLDADTSELPDVLTILNGQKIKAFAECILGNDTCVIDGHAYNIAQGKRLSLTSDKVNVGVRVFRELQAAYVRAGKLRDLKGYEMQAITWTAWRRLHKIDTSAMKSI